MKIELGNILLGELLTDFICLNKNQTVQLDTTLVTSCDDVDLG